MNPLVSVTWLFEQIQHPNTVVFDATLPPVGVIPQANVHARYLAKHLPGAIYFDIDKLSDHTTTLPHMLPTPEIFSRMMSDLGVSENMNIVVYEQEGVFSAPRAWWTLRTFGAKNVFILDGGLRAWNEAGLPVQSGQVQRTPLTFRACLNTTAVKNFEQIQQMIAEHGQILDARSAGRFNGILPEPRAGLSSGHMPGALNIPFSDLTEEGRLKSPEKLREIFSDKRVNIQLPITTTCGSGVTAAVIALALEIVGAKEVSLYDGSWAEYGLHPEAVIEKA